MDHEKTTWSARGPEEGGQLGCVGGRFGSRQMRTFSCIFLHVLQVG